MLGLTTKPKRREALPRTPPQVETAYLLHRTDENMGRVHGRVVWFEDVTADPERFAGLEYNFTFDAHETQSADEFNELVDTAIGVVNGKLKNVTFIVPRKRPYPPMSMTPRGIAFHIAEDLADQIRRTGEPDTGAWTIIRYPGQTPKGMREVLDYLANARKDYEKEHPPRELLIDKRPSCWFTPDPNAKVFTP